MRACIVGSAAAQCRATEGEPTSARDRQGMSPRVLARRADAGVDLARRRDGRVGARRCGRASSFAVGGDEPASSRRGFPPVVKARGARRGAPCGVRWHGTCERARSYPNALPKTHSGNDSGASAKRRGPRRSRRGGGCVASRRDPLATSTRNDGVGVRIFSGKRRTCATPRNLFTKSCGTAASTEAFACLIGGAGFGRTPSCGAGHHPGARPGDAGTPAQADRRRGRPL